MMNREGILELMRQKESIERDIQVNWQILENQKNVGMEEALVDAEGYPRNDIDVAQVRHARHQIICLKNDFKSKMTEIEKGLHELHQNDKNKSKDTVMKSSNSSIDHNVLDSFLLVKEVSSGSPAFEADLQVGDEIFLFGSVTSSNFENLQDIASVVRNSIEKKIKIRVKRKHEKFDLTLIPKSWSGKGFLGCNIIPLKK